MNRVDIAEFNLAAGETAERSIPIRSEGAQFTVQYKGVSYSGHMGYLDTTVEVNARFYVKDGELWYSIRHRPFLSDEEFFESPAKKVE